MDACPRSTLSTDSTTAATLASASTSIWPSSDSSRWSYTIGARYVFVGGLERASARPEGIAKFAAGRPEYRDVVYDRKDVQIYRTTPRCDKRSALENIALEERAPVHPVERERR